jgi:hypothetical protein
LAFEPDEGWSDVDQCGNVACQLRAKGSRAGFVDRLRSNSRIRPERSVAALIGQLSLTVTPPRCSSTSMERSSTVGRTGGATATGTDCSDTVTTPASRASLRQPCTMLALMPCAIAPLATEAPGRSHSARICTFSSAPYAGGFRCPGAASGGNLIPGTGHASGREGRTSP